MNTETVICLSIAAASVCYLAWLLGPADDAAAGVALGNAEEDLRLLRICDRCRKVLSPSRMIRQGQHLSVCHDICQSCANQRDAEVLSLTDSKVRKLKLV